MATEEITIRGAREHNLKNIDVTLPRDRLVVVTGLSGSGKSTLAFDTIYAEGQRRYVESLSAYARQFLGQMNKPDVDTIEGLSPAISIEQKTVSRNPRSTVGTVTEIYDYLRLLYARVGTPHCYNCGDPIRSQTTPQIVDVILSRPAGTRIYVLAPVVRGRKGEYHKEFAQWAKAGFVRARVDGKILELGGAIRLDKKYKHDIDVFVDRLAVKDGIRTRLTDSVETALKLGDGLVRIEVVDKGGNVQESTLLSEKFACVNCGISYPDLEPRMFSFNNPHGACAECDGLGAMLHFDPQLIVPDRDVSIAEGAIAPWAGKKGKYVENTLEALQQHFEFDLDVPWRKLPKRIRKMLLEGSDEDVRFFYQRGKRRYYYSRPWEGIIERLDRFYEESSSDRIREELERYMNPLPCDECGGARLRKEARHVFVGGKPIHEVTAWSIRDAAAWFADVKLTEREAEIARRILKELRERLKFLLDIGLDYLSLDRTSGTLSGGEGQRIRLATQVSSSLVGVLYILDEPSIGLHQRDNKKLLETLARMRDLGNTVVVVEHDEETILAADHVVDLGPGAGVRGGEVVYSGPPAGLLDHPSSLTGKYLSGRESIPIPTERKKPTKRKIVVEGATEHNLKKIDVTFPLGCFISVTGVSGSGKSTLIIDTLYRALAQRLYRSRGAAGAHTRIKGLEHIDKVIDIDQSPIGRTPRSNPATYTGVFTHIRDLFSQLPESRARGYKPGRFSFNVKGGRCEACQGDGLVKIEMHFLPDIYVRCDQCGGKRYNRQTLEVEYKGKNIHQVLEMTVAEAREFFDRIPALSSRLQILDDVGLGYVKLGQPATTLSGGEAQRIKLARELSKRETSRTLYILDEPTTGLHFADVDKLLEVLHRLVSTGNTVIVIEHNLEVIKVSDWVIDLGPEGGDRGGEVVVAGPPEDVARHPSSYTGKFLREFLERSQSRLGTGGAVAKRAAAGNMS